MRLDIILIIAFVITVKLIKNYVYQLSWYCQIICHSIIAGISINLSYNIKVGITDKLI